MALGSSVLGEGVLGVGESEPQGALACDVVGLNYSSIIYAAISGDIAGLSGSFILNSVNHAELIGDIAGLSGSFLPNDSLLADVVGLSGSFTAFSYDIGVLSGNIAGLSGSFTSTSTTFGALSGDIAGLSGEFKPHDLLVCDIVGLSGSFVVEISDTAILSGDIVGLSGQLFAKESILSTLSADVVGLSGYSLGALIGDVFSFEWQNGQISYVDTGANLATVTNIRTGEVTRYTNYAIMAILNIGNKRIGMRSDGLYELAGDTDYDPVLPVKVNGTIVTKDFDFDTFKSKRMSYAYLHSDTETKKEVII